MRKKDILTYCFTIGYIVTVFSGLQLYFANDRTMNLGIQAVVSKQVACFEKISSLSSCDMYSLLLK